jgi:alginate O-acetyltransferase complex protein AlgI
MTFVDPRFALFFLGFAVVYWVLKSSRPARSVLLIVASYGLFAHFDAAFAIAILMISLVDFTLSKGLANSEGKAARKALVAISALVNLGALVAIRHLGISWTPFASADSTIVAASPHLAVPFVIGIAFFAFQTFSHTVDVYRHRIGPTESLLDYLVYIAFFPRLFAGPVTRAADFIPQLAERPTLSPERRGLALFLLTSGLVKKVVIADYLALNLVDKVFDLPTLFSTTEVLLAIYGYTIQLYCELSGYTEIALALGLLLGIEMTGNFRFPLAAPNLREFWDRWFISISSWFRDYIFTPIAGNGSVNWRKVIGVSVAFALAALWCGPRITFFVWAACHTIALLITGALNRKPSTGVLRIVGAFFTFNFVVATFAIFRAADLTAASELWIILKEGIWPAPNVTGPVYATLGIALLGAWMPQKWYDSLRNAYAKLPLPIQLAFAALVFLVIMKVATAGTIPFVYERL